MLTLLTNPLFLIFAPATLVPLAAIICHSWVKHSRNSQDAGLKMEMIQRGMSADEIVQVLEARSGKDERRRFWRRGEDRIQSATDAVRRC
jgi:hypothetical protein